jgi:hypothetical protein
VQLLLAIQVTTLAAAVAVVGIFQLAAHFMVLVVQVAVVVAVTQMLVRP